MKRRFIKGNNLWVVCDEKCPEDTEGGVLKNVLHNYSLNFRLLPSEISIYIKDRFIFIFFQKTYLELFI